MSRWVRGRRAGFATAAVLALLVATAGVGLAAPDDPSTDLPEPGTATPSVDSGVAAVPDSPAIAALATDDAYTIIFDDGCKLATIGLTDGVVTPFGPSFTSLACVADLTFGNDGALYGIIGGLAPLRAHLVRFDLTTGAPFDLGPLTGSFATSETFGSSDVGIAAGAGNHLYVTMGTDETPACGPVLCVYDVNPASLVATLVGPLGAPSSEFDDTPTLTMTADCGTNLWTVMSRNDDVQQLFLTSISESTGAADTGPVIGLTSGANPFGIELDKRSRTLYLIANDVQTPRALYTLDPSSGATTPVAELTSDGGFQVQRLAIPGTCPVAIAAEPTFAG